MTYHYTYNITCLCGSLKDHYYYGQHSTDDLDDGYCGSGTILQNYYNKYGAIENVTYTKTIIDFYSNLTELNQAEYELIGDKYETDSMCLNLRAGGNKAGMSKKTRRKMSKSAKRRPCPMKGKKFSEEAKNNMKKGHQNISMESRQKMSMSALGKVLSMETRQKMSKSRMGRVAWNEGMTKEEMEYYKSLSIEERKEYKLNKNTQ